VFSWFFDDYFLANALHRMNYYDCLTADFEFLAVNGKMNFNSIT